jgi:hypothetical protein
VKVITDLPQLDHILSAYATELAGDFAGYRHHTYRVVNLCVALSGGDERQLDKIAIAAAFHDIGIWTDRTFDYLGPSVVRAREYLAAAGRADWIAEVTAMILQHHKITAWRSPRPEWLVESFRRADWIDVSRGLLRFGLPRAFITAVQSRWPSAGFHRRLVALELERIRTHPWSPLPMMRL